MAGDISGETERTLKKIQYGLYKKGIPVLILIEGCGGDIMGRLINEVMTFFEPRGMEYHHFRPDVDADPLHVLRFIEETPANGRIGLYDRGWYSSFIESVPDDDERYGLHMKRICNMERYIVDNGTRLVKIYLDMQADSVLDNRESYPRTISGDCGNLGDDSARYSDYDVSTSRIKRILKESERPFAPWAVVRVEDFGKTVSSIVHTIIDRLSQDMKSFDQNAEEDPEEIYPNPRDELDFTDKAGDGYQERLAGYQAELSSLQCQLAKSDRSLVLLFEGWDAAGKGGSIRRVTRALNPRGYNAVPIMAPVEEESSHSYLWRFCRNIPKKGRITVFDRSWYGRMMVEPIEGFCTDAEYRRSAREINLFERVLTDSNVVLIKIWMEITPEEQLKRFDSREKDPMKSWKITDEDWRNRSKWKQYEGYVDSMMRRTNTPSSPWHVVVSEDKKFGRLEILRLITETLKKKLE